MRSRERGVAGERGQSTAFVATMLFVMLLFVAVVANVGQAVNRRIALQVVADSGAYTGASVMATGLNQLAFWNTAMQWAWFVFTFPQVPGLDGVGSPLWPAFKAQQAGDALPDVPIGRLVSVLLTGIPTVECNVATEWIELYRASYTAMGLAYDAENIGYALLARQEARRVSDFNVADLLPNEQIEYAEWDVDPASGPIVPGLARNYGVLAHTVQVPDKSLLKAVRILGHVPPGWLQESILVPGRDHLNYACFTVVPASKLGVKLDFYVYQYRSEENLPLWRYKTPREFGATTDSFVWIAKAPATRALLFDSLFGGNAIPEMKAAAVAKPIGGHIEEGRWDYIVKMMPLGTVLAGNRLVGALLPGWFQSWTTDNVGFVVDDGYDRGARMVTH